MKTENVLALMNQIKNEYGKNSCLSFVTVRQLNECIETLTLEQQKATAKANGRSDIYAVVRNILNNAAKSSNQSLHGAWVQDGMQYACDSYRAIQVFEPVDVPELNKGAKPLDVAKFFNNPQADIELALPDIRALKADIAQAKANFRVKAGSSRARCHVLYRFDNGALVNAEYLYDGIRATGATTAMTSKNAKGLLINPVYLYSDKCNYMFVPIHPGVYGAITNTGAFAIAY